MPAPLAVPVIMNVGRYILTAGAKRAAKKYGDDVVKQVQKSAKFKKLQKEEMKDRVASAKAVKEGKPSEMTTYFGKNQARKGDPYKLKERGEFSSEKLPDAEIAEIPLKFSKGGLLSDDRVMYKDGGPGIEALRKVAPEVVERMGYEEGGSIDDQMMMVMTSPMESDEDMENGYTRFIMEEALTEEEEDMLMSKLEQDEELAMIFDKVIDVAQEFAGAGPVEGPGSGVSDSIPARLSDGEFVFTAKAVEEIGADNLMAMMKDAEAKADERQPLQEGGIPELREETRPIETPKMVEQTIRVERGPQTEQVGVSGSLLDSREEDEEYTNPLERPPIHGAYTR